METTKLLAGETNILSHGSTQGNAMDMGVAANERAHQTAYTMKRLNFFKRFLVTLCRGMCKNRPFLVVFGSQIQLQTRYGQAGWCISKRTSNYIYC
jgi:hypothetical protein